MVFSEYGILSVIELLLLIVIIVKLFQRPREVVINHTLPTKGKKGKR